VSTIIRPQPSDLDLLRHDLLIGGEWVAGAGGERDDVTDPATGETIARVARGTREDARRAIVAADGALGAWSATPAKGRAAVLRAWHDLIVEHVDDLAALLTAE
jgi:succinate-semialdehyde dehydrogenase / glutarate-semialdehyde dehydrogenase